MYDMYDSHCNIEVNCTCAVRPNRRARGRDRHVMRVFWVALERTDEVNADDGHDGPPPPRPDQQRERRLLPAPVRLRALVPPQLPRLPRRQSHRRHPALDPEAHRVPDRDLAPPRALALREQALRLGGRPLTPPAALSVPRHREAQGRAQERGRRRHPQRPHQARGAQEKLVRAVRPPP